jgi:hypothetical protein
MMTIMMNGTGSVDLTVQRLVRESPGLSLYQIAKRTKWRIGKVDGSVRRLVNAKRVFLVGDERNGRKVSLVFPSRLKPVLTITVPSGLLKGGNPTWLNEANVYALDNHTIGITGEPIAE